MADQITVLEQLNNIAGNLAVSQKSLESLLANNVANEFATFAIEPDSSLCQISLFISKPVDLSLFSKISAAIELGLKGSDLGLGNILSVTNTVVTTSSLNWPTTAAFCDGLCLQIATDSGWATVATGTGWPLTTSALQFLTSGLVARGGFGLCRFVFDWSTATTITGAASSIGVANILKFRGKIYCRK